MGREFVPTELYKSTRSSNTEKQINNIFIMGICIIKGVIIMIKNITLLAATIILSICSTSLFAKPIDVMVYADRDYPPYSYVEDGKVKGIYTDILEKAFSRMVNYRVKIQAVPWRRGLQYIERGVGFALYPPYYHPDNRSYINPYSVPILEENVVVVCTDKTLYHPRKNWPEDYYGLRIGSNSGYDVGGDKFNKALKEGKIMIEETEGNRKNILMLGNYRIDCYINDRLSIRWELKRLRESGDYRKHYAAIKEGAVISSQQGFLGFTDSDNGQFYFKDDFVKEFNAIINEMKSTGEIQKMIDDFINR